MKFVLASGSPRRKELLESIGMDFVVDIPHIEERRAPEEEPHDYVRRLAREKGAVVAERRPGAHVIAADTIVVLGEDVLEKPTDQADARKMLAALVGRTHVVWTGVALIPPAAPPLTAVVRSEVTMGELDQELIRWYVGTGEPMDKAGAYAVQGIGAMFIERIDGSYTNVVGLPLATVRELVAEAGVDLTRQLRIRS